MIFYNIFGYVQRCAFYLSAYWLSINGEVYYSQLYRRDTCFDAHLFRRLFCLFHLILCARSNDVIASFFCKQHSHTLSRKNKLKVSYSNVRNNWICQCIAVWSNFLKLKFTHHIKVCQWCNSHVTLFIKNDETPLCCMVHVLYFVCNNACVLLIGKHCSKPLWN